MAPEVTRRGGAEARSAPSDNDRKNPSVLHRGGLTVAQRRARRAWGSIRRSQHMPTQPVEKAQRSLDAFHGVTATSFSGALRGLGIHERRWQCMTRRATSSRSVRVQAARVSSALRLAIHPSPITAAGAAREGPLPRPSLQPIEPMAIADIKEGCANGFRAGRPWRHIDPLQEVLARLQPVFEIR